MSPLVHLGSKSSSSSSRQLVAVGMRRLGDSNSNNNNELILNSNLISKTRVSDIYAIKAGIETRQENGFSA